MTSLPEDPTSNGGKLAESKATSSIAKSSFFEKDNEISGDTVPGWTIMRPLRKKGLKRSPSGIMMIDTISGNETQRDSTAEGDLKIMDSTRTDGSGDGYNDAQEVENLHDVRSDDELLEDEHTTRQPDQAIEHTSQNDASGSRPANGETQYKVYKRRWFGLIQLVLLNIIVSWDVSALPTLSSFATLPYLHLNNILLTTFSGWHSLRTQLLLHNTTMCQKRRSTGSVQRSYLHLLLYHPSPSLSSTEADRNYL